MQALAFWKAVTQDRADFLDQFLSLLTDNAIRYCVIDGHAVNAYAEPLVSLDLDVAVATEDLDRVETLLSGRFRIERFPHSVNVSAAGSQLRVQIQTDRRYAAFVPRAAPREVLGVTLQVAAVEDVLQERFGRSSTRNAAERSVRRIWQTSAASLKRIRTFARAFPPRFWIDWSEPDPESSG